LNMLRHAIRAIEAGDANTVVLLAGDHFGAGDFDRLVSDFNGVTRDHLATIPTGGPNAQFAFLTERHMAATGLRPHDYGMIPVAQRRWARLNPGAVYRDELTLDDYLSAPVVAPPLVRYDCVPVVSGANAVVVTSATTAGPAVRVPAVRAAFNHDNGLGDGLSTGLRPIAEELWAASNFSPESVDLAAVYDDYPVMSLVQLDDVGLIPDGDFRTFLHDRVWRDRWPLNPSGGQLSAGQAGAAGGMHGLVEAVRQLLGKAGERQVADAARAIVTGYGMVTYLYGSCAIAATLERRS